MSFVTDVESILLPLLADLGFDLSDQAEGRAFGDALVELHGPGIRLRIVRDRGQVFADFAAPSDPGRWFNSDIVMRMLNVSHGGGFNSTEVEQSLLGIGKFLQTFHSELRSAFGSVGYRMTKTRLEELERESAERF